MKLLVLKTTLQEVSNLLQQYITLNEFIFLFDLIKNVKGTVMQIEKALTNDCLRASKVS